MVNTVFLLKLQVRGEMFNKRVWIINFWIALFLLAVGGTEAYAEDVAAIMVESNNLYNAVLEGFKNTFNGSVRDYSMGGSDDEGIVIIRRAKASSPKLIFTIGNKATKLAKANVSDTPILFSLVMSPAQSGLVGKNICGISLNVAAKDQLQALKDAAPLVRKVGVIYNPEINSNLISEAKTAAQELGLEIIETEARSTPEVSDAINGLSGRIDAFWMIIDPLVSNSDVLKRLLIFTLSAKIPLIVPALGFVEGGGLLAVTLNYSNIGKQAGEMANQLLSGSKTPEAFGVQTPANTGLALNLKTAKTIDLNIPQPIIDNATRVYKQ
jgi:putative tryptophan/tyrosine transport system substrate-binding protein